MRNVKCGEEEQKVSSAGARAIGREKGLLAGYAADCVAVEQELCLSKDSRDTQTQPPGSSHARRDLHDDGGCG